MRTLLLLPLLLVRSCTNFTGDPARDRSARAADTQVVATALSYFVRSDDTPVWKLKTGESILYVNSRYERDKGFISKDHLAFDLDLTGESRWQVPEDARQDMESRTVSKERLPKQGLPSFVRVCDLDFPGVSVNELYMEYPHALSFAWLYPPGYTRDGRHAVVVFSFTPNSDAFYLLERHENIWRVIRHHTISFPD